MVLILMMIILFNVIDELVYPSKKEGQFLLGLNQ